MSAHRPSQAPQREREPAPPPDSGVRSGSSAHERPGGSVSNLPAPPRVGVLVEPRISAPIELRVSSSAAQRPSLIAAARASLPPPAKAPPLQRGLSIAQKLGLLIGVLIVAIVVPLTAYMGSRQLDVLRRDLERRADTYAQLLSSQVRTAVAFDDRETAREAFTALSSDPDLSSVVLFTEKGAVLESWGSPSELAQRAKSGVTERKVFSLGDRVLAVVPVVSLEGPKGSLALELSKRNLLADRSRVLTSSLMLGGVALAAGVALALWIAHTFARRLRAIDRVAGLVAAGDLEQSAVRDDARDEIGSLARSFGVMLEQIKRLIAEMASRAEQEQVRLEGLVEQRTHALARRNDDMRRVLDNVDQGFLTIDRDGRMSAERSRILQSWLGEAPRSGLLRDYLEAASPGIGGLFQIGWDQVLEGFMPVEAALEQMPRRITVGNRHLAVEYKPMGNEAAEGALVMMSDITAALERARLEEEEREVVHLFTRMLEDRATVLDFVAETNRLIEQVVRHTPSDIVVVKRLVHTLKGNTALFGLDSMAKLCHRVEDRMQESRGSITEADREELQGHWQRLSSKLGRFMDGPKVGNVTFNDEEYRAVLDAIAAGAPHRQIATMVEAWRLDPVEPRLNRLAKQAENLAGRLGKLPLSVRVEAGPLRVEPEQLAEVWSSLPHLVRNALDHGLEAGSERIAAGKPESAELVLRAAMQGDRFMIEVQDSGRGVDWEAVRRRAVELGIPSQTPAELERALFADGLSTRATVTEESGRGVGTAAVARAVEAAGGRVEVFSEAGRGARFRLSWPASVARDAGTNGVRGRRTASVAKLAVGEREKSG